MASSLEVNGLDAGYGAVRVLEDVSIRVSAGETVVLLGTNGNGKSTLMKCIMGILPPAAGSIIAEIDGEPIDLVGRSTEAIVDLGISLVPEGRRLFPKLSVEEILAVLFRLNEGGLAIVLIEHIMRTVMRFSTRLVILVAGQKIADGMPQQAIESPEVERAYLGE